MTSNNQTLLIINNDQSLPNALEQAVNELKINTAITTIQNAIDQLNSNDEITAAVLDFDSITSDQITIADEIIDILHKASKHMLVLADDMTTLDKGTFQHLNNTIMPAAPNESPDMLKGRLATLMQLQPLINDMAAELHQLRTVGQPMSSYFTKVDEEMRLAARIQRDFLPQKLPSLPGLHFASIYRPATWVSGDIFDVMRLDENHIGFYIADVVGHGMPAALLTMFIKRALITKKITGHSYRLVDPGEALQELNDEFINQRLSDFQFATCCYILLNIKTLKIKLASAGHPFPMQFDNNGNLTEIKAKGSLLGIFNNQEYTTTTHQLNPGDKLLIYSDGVEVAFTDNEPDEPQRFREEFQELATKDIDTMSNKLVEIIESEEGSLHPRDDVTIVGLQIAPDYPIKK